MLKLNLERVVNIVLGSFHIALAIFLLIAILTYDKLDPSLNTVTNSQVVHNWMDSAGAQVADLAVQLLGVVSFFLVALMVVAGINFLRMKSGGYNIYVKVIAFVIFVTSCCALVSKLFQGENCWQYDTWGGALGYYLNNITIAVPSQALLIVYVSLLLTSMYILTNFSPKWFRRTMRKIYKSTGSFFMFILKLPHRLVKLLVLGSWRLLKFRKRKASLIMEPVPSRKKIEQSGQTDVPRTLGGKKDEQKYDIPSKEENSSPEPEMDKRKRPKMSVFSFFAGGKESSSEGKYKLPTLELLGSSNGSVVDLTKEELKLQAGDLLRVLREYKITGKIVGIKVGPIITLHEFEPSAGTKSSRIIGCADDIARNLRVESARISVIAEKNVVGIELPNRQRNTIFLRDILALDDYRNSNYALPVVLGLNIAGAPVIMDLTRAPHLLIAGTTGSGKSVCINTMILSLLYKFHPSECKMIMIDPK
ncbi:MAG: DNA translocase FtsK 4TM domain-containing protein, partial [Rickettsiales bacterium]|nr:DNA translocase FtsK 4TM domain-containing protein [Rickettsiales bacterium]